MARFDRVAPVLPVSDVGAALEHYAKLGFTATGYAAASDEYGFLERDGVQMHVSRVDGLEPATNMVSVYVYVDDADAVAAAWRAAGAGGRFFDAEDTAYGLREACHVDPDGNLIRFGSQR
jgi:predicted enzyme related to lactoylglutathione lyase